MREVIEAMVQPLMSTDAPPCEICYSQIEQLSAAGFVIVPKEPTPEMLANAINPPDDILLKAMSREIRIWRAMIAASQETGDDA